MINILMPEVEMKVLNLLKDAKKIMKHCKRKHLKGSDLDLAHKTKLEDPFLMSIKTDFNLRKDDDEDVMMIDNKVDNI